MALSAAQVKQAFEAVVGVEPRLADLQVLSIVSDGELTETHVAEYLWDHFLGEPEHPTEAEIQVMVERAVAV